MGKHIVFNFYKLIGLASFWLSLICVLALIIDVSSVEYSCKQTETSIMFVFSFIVGLFCLSLEKE